MLDCVETALPRPGLAALQGKPGELGELGELGAGRGMWRRGHGSRSSLHPLRFSVRNIFLSTRASSWISRYTLHLLDRIVRSS